MDLELNGRIALVTGGSRGIGRAIAATLAREGAAVTLTYGSSEDLAASLVEEIEKSGGTAEAMKLDVRDPSACVEKVKELVAKKGALHILVNNAGVAIDNLILRYKDEDLDTVFRTNVFGPFALARAAARPMSKARFGRIVFIGSVVGQMGNTGQAAYAATKAALEGLSKSLARELASRNVTSNVIAPGFIDTDMTKDLADEAKTKMLEAIPLGAMGTPSDVADAVAFLSSARARYITGHTLSVNGGLYM